MPNVLSCSFSLLAHLVSYPYGNQSLKLKLLNSVSSSVRRDHATHVDLFLFPGRAYRLVTVNRAVNYTTRCADAASITALPGAYNKRRIDVLTSIQDDVLNHSTLLSFHDGYTQEQDTVHIEKSTFL